MALLDVDRLGLYHHQSSIIIIIIIINIFNVA